MLGSAGLVVLLLACSEPAPQPVRVAEPLPLAPLQVHVDRAGRTLFLHRGAEVERSAPVGIGRGGLLDKSSMSDLVTPTGIFTVDLVLHEGGELNAVAEPERLGELSLDQLWRNMSGIDFDGDGQPDRAYGGVYVGLNGEGTGPKMRQHSRSGTAYWYSIALHATPLPENLGAANSGGCVHVDEQLLLSLVEDGTLGLGSTVVIADGGP